MDNDHDKVTPGLIVSFDISSSAAVFAEVVVDISGSEAVVAEFAFIGWRQHFHTTSLSELESITFLVTDGAIASAELPIGDFREIHLVFDLSTVARANKGGSSRSVGRHCQVRGFEVYCIYIYVRSAWVAVSSGIGM